MFLEYYNLREQPFGVTPDSRFLYFGDTHREAYASLLYMIETKRGFSALVAEPGMGKTSLLFRMLETMRAKAKTAFLFQTDGDERDLLCSMLRDLGINCRGRDLPSLHDDLNRALLQEMESGKQVVVVIDEAQNLSEKALESVRLLSNFETPTQKLMHIVLAGQPGLGEKLSRSGMTQLRQRVSTIIRLEPFTLKDTAKYIEHRLRVAGHEGTPIFSAGALELIARVSQGIPRNINSLCFQALSIGFATQVKTIGAEILREVVADTDFNPRHRPPTRTHRTSAPTREPSQVTPSENRWMANVMPDTNSSGGWAEYAPKTAKSFHRENSHRGTWMAVLLCAALPFLSLAALSDPRLGFTQTLPGRVSANIMNAMLNSAIPNADFVPDWPRRLRPPPPPSINPANGATPSKVNNPLGAPGQDIMGGSDQSNHDPAPETTSIVIPKGMTAIEIAYQYLGKADPETVATIRAMNPRIRSASEVIPKWTRVEVPPRTNSATAQQTNAYHPNPDAPDTSRANIASGPTQVQVLHSETLFQFAVERFGTYNWDIIAAIGAANPQIHGPYDILSPGEWIQIPGEIEAVSSGRNAQEISNQNH